MFADKTEVNIQEVVHALIERLDEEKLRRAMERDAEVEGIILKQLRILSAVSEDANPSMVQDSTRNMKDLLVIWKELRSCVLM